MPLDRHTLAASGFVHNADEGLFFETRTNGCVFRFGLRRSEHEAPGAGSGHEIELLDPPLNGVLAVERTWTTAIHPHPDGDPQITLEQWAQDARRRMTERATNVLACSFCGKTQAQVAKLIAGPSVYICNECAELTYEIAKT